MSEITSPVAVAPLLPMLWRQAWAQIVTTWRIPAFTVSGLALPVILFSFFGLPYVNNHLDNGVSVGAYLLASFGAYSVSSVMVFSFGIGVATDRGQKLDLLMRATPLPPGVYLGGRVITALVFGLIALTVLLAFGTLVGGVPIGADVWLTLIARLLVGSLPFIGVGFAIGYLAGPNAAPGIVNLIFLPLSFGSGIFVPLSQLPRIVQAVAPYLPTYHYGQLAWSAVGAADESLITSFIWLVGYGIALFAIAVWAYRREATRRFS